MTRVDKTSAVLAVLQDPSVPRDNAAEAWLALWALSAEEFAEIEADAKAHVKDSVEDLILRAVRA